MTAPSGYLVKAENQLQSLHVCLGLHKEFKALGSSTGLVVMWEDSCSEGREFKSQHHILDGHLSHLFVVRIVICVWKDENKWKRDRGWHFKKIFYSIAPLLEEFRHIETSWSRYKLLHLALVASRAIITIMLQPIRAYLIGAAKRLDPTRHKDHML